MEGPLSAIGWPGVLAHERPEDALDVLEGALGHADAREVDAELAALLDAGGDRFEVTEDGGLFEHPVAHGSHELGVGAERWRLVSFSDFAHGRDFFAKAVPREHLVVDALPEPELRRTCGGLKRATYGALGRGPAEAGVGVISIGGDINDLRGIGKRGHCQHRCHHYRLRERSEWPMIHLCRSFCVEVVGHEMPSREAHSPRKQRRALVSSLAWGQVGRIWHCSQHANGTRMPNKSFLAQRCNRQRHRYHYRFFTHAVPELPARFLPLPSQGRGLG